MQAAKLVIVTILGIVIGSPTSSMAGDSPADQSANSWAPEGIPALLVPNYVSLDIWVADASTGSDDDDWDIDDDDDWDVNEPSDAAETPSAPVVAPDPWYAQTWLWTTVGSVIALSVGATVISMD